MRRSRRKRWRVEKDMREFRARSRTSSPQATPLATLDRHSGVKATPEGRIILKLPERLDFEANYERTSTIFRQLREATLKGRRVKRVRFDRIKYISPAAALVLASEVDIWNHRVGGRLKPNIDSWDKDIRRLLCEMGYFELLGLERPTTPIPSGSVTFLNFRRGTSGPVDKGKLAKELRIDIERITGQGIRKHEFFQGLSEAMVNVGHHAYPATAPGNKFWWQSASFDRRDRTLTVMFYDQGIGIPASLPPGGLIERLRARFASWPDSLKIKTAMKYGRSSTRRGERGKGLQDVAKFAKAYPEGRLSIYSGNGLYRIRHTNDDKVQVRLRDHKNSVGGTLIEWSVRL